MEKFVGWAQFGLNGHKIRAGDPAGWRCFLGDDPREISLVAWEPEGECVPRVNYITGTSKTGNRHGLVGWVLCYGECILENGVLRIVLQIPATPPPKN